MPLENDKYGQRNDCEESRMDIEYGNTVMNTHDETTKKHSKMGANQYLKRETRTMDVRHPDYTWRKHISRLKREKSIGRMRVDMISSEAVWMYITVILAH